ncbi:hypothetical protein BUALT_Bualt10G0044200 [Buddleja alternifolia]|uniref:Uncharacterized protein n=1 Tax=Buddleja alternifolia TaxID=168488 RepID=A0AAV6X6R5_9LAMI|nr:hypothetical protein BUALT_Bualt10G0044200 [Buddleja alternifolia]
MAPKKKERNDDESPAAVTATTRATRSATRRANSALTPPPAADPEPPKSKKAKITPTAAKQEGEGQPDGSKTTITIEHCKQCNAFKTRAIQVKNGLEKDVAGVKVVVNPEKPRRGCFEIRKDGGEIFISLKDMKRPFKPMKDLDMDKCNAFKTRAIQVKNGLEKDIMGVKVVVNPEKPRMGCFEIHEEGGGGIFIRLKDMKRPFKPMKYLDMD